MTAPRDVSDYIYDEHDEYFFDDEEDIEYETDEEVPATNSSINE